MSKEIGRDKKQHLCFLKLPRVKGGNGRLQPIPLRLSRILGKWINTLRHHDQEDLNSLLFCGRHSERSLTTRQIRFFLER
jgi:hypothetical protein